MEEWEGTIEDGWVVVRYRMKSRAKPDYAIAHIEAVPGVKEEVTRQHGAAPATFAIVANELAKPVVLKTMGHALMLIKYLAGKDDAAPVLH